MNAGFNPSDTQIKGSGSTQPSRLSEPKGDFSAVMSGSLSALSGRVDVSKETKPETFSKETKPEVAQEQKQEVNKELYESPSFIDPVVSQVTSQLKQIEQKTNAQGDTLFKEGIAKAEQNPEGKAAEQSSETENGKSTDKGSVLKEPEKATESKKMPEKDGSESSKKSEEFLQKISEKKPEQLSQGDLLRNAAIENSKKSFAAVASEKFATMRMEQRKVLEGLGTIKAAPTPNSAAVSEGISLGLQAAQNKGGTTYVQAKSEVRTPAFKMELFDTLNASISRKLNTVTMKLAPESLGAMKIQIEMKGDELTMSVMAKDGQTASLIASTLQELKDSFAEKGMDLVQVTINQEGAGQNDQDNAKSDPFVASRGDGETDPNKDSSNPKESGDDGVISRA